MNVVGIIRAKDSERWIAEVLTSLLKVCGHVVVLDDHSTDNMAKVALSVDAKISCIASPFSTINEARDKMYLVEQCRQFHPNWILCVDADEVLLDHTLLLENISSKRSSCYSLNVKFLWNSPSTIRTDGCYGDFWRPSLFEASRTNGKWTVGDGADLHCSAAPNDVAAAVVRTQPPVRLKHYGPMLKEDRIRKYYWYLEHDKVNGPEYYACSIQGDLQGFPVDAKYMHGGPLRLEPFKE